ncbi:hypothetical protein [Rhodococcus erythropolis]|uniref:hypothetical protein n=1 Tax=Rhodococcus erythropolis TaxID=1833 RepID=UPI001BE9371D|nr:hypothetical protein [Rhodococcus erythropolis]MBT2265614.1 hypothetical protein [Rhodococcus erythropolis]
MKHVGREAAALLNGAGIELSEGLTDAEFDSVHERFGFHFNPDHRSLLATALPLGDRWPNWRSADDLELGTWLDTVTEGFIWDALHQQPPFWPASWGRMPASPSPWGSPVISAWQTDIVYYGANLLEYLANEFPHGQGRKTLSPISVRVPFWSRFIDAANRAESI